MNAQDKDLNASSFSLDFLLTKYLIECPNGNYNLRYDERFDKLFVPYSKEFVLPPSGVSRDLAIFSLGLLIRGARE